jgi:hypothetical protein
MRISRHSRRVIQRLLTRIGYAALRAGIRLSKGSLINTFVDQGRTIDWVHNLRINYVLDVGANKGLFAKHLRMTGYKGHILCFEPLRDDCELIQN